MKNDPILQELRKIRDKIAKECDYDVDKYFELVKTRKTNHKNPTADIEQSRTLHGVAENQSEYKTKSGG